MEENPIDGIPEHHNDHLNLENPLKIALGIYLKVEILSEIYLLLVIIIIKLININIIITD